MMKQIATGRKNWLHGARREAGRLAANLMAIVNSAALNKPDVLSGWKG